VKPQYSARYASPEEIQEIIDDLNLVHCGARIYFAIDPFEVVKYCFPIDPTSWAECDVNSIADHQTALYEIFYGQLHAQPLILEEYVDEMERHTMFLRHHVNEVYQQKDMVNIYIETAQLEEIPSSQEIVDALQEKFGALLAAVMGIYSLGADRFHAVAKRLTTLGHLVEDHELEGSERSVLREIIQAYKSTSLAGEIYDALQSDFETRPSDRLTTERRRKADRRDANAVDRLLHLNVACEKAFRKGNLKRRILFLYLSSAPKSKRIFQLPALRQKLPIVNGTKYCFLRTKNQLFCYAVNKSPDSDPRANAQTTRSNLTIFKGLLEEVNQLDRGFVHDPQKDCTICILEGGEVQACRWLKLCEKVRDLESAITNRQMEMDNLGLLATIGKYQNLLKAKPVGDSQHSVFESFRLAFGDQELVGTAFDRMRILQDLTVTQSIFTKMLPKGATESAYVEDIQKADKSGFSRYELPTQGVFQDATYREIVDTVIRAYVHRDESEPFDRDPLKRACEKFVSLEAKMRGVNAEHELTRCYLFLSFFLKEGDKAAYDSAALQIERFPELRAEYCYFLTWLGRRLALYAETDSKAAVAVGEFPGDPRLSYNRAANAFTWLCDDRAAEKCPLTVRDAIGFAEDALEKYKSDPAKYHEPIAATYNNIAYFAVHDMASDGFDLERGKEFLRKLCQELPEEEWKGHAEYYHTKALVLCREFERRRDSGESIAELRELLEQSAAAVGRADEIRHKPLYGELKRTLKSYLREGRATVSSA
jgi:hypothetical protein